MVLEKILYRRCRRFDVGKKVRVVYGIADNIKDARFIKGYIYKVAGGRFNKILYIRSEYSGIFIDYQVHVNNKKVFRCYQI